MDWEIKIDKDQKLLEIITSGLLDKNSSLEMAKVIAKTMKKNRLKRALIDHRNVTELSGEIIDIYERPKLFRIIGMFLGIKIAEIINPEHTDHFKFLETVCLNRGFRFSIFFDKPAALSWLLDDKILFLSL